jgi:CBS domain-containing protein
MPRTTKTTAKSTTSSKTTAQVMTPDPVCLLESETLRDAAQKMRDRDIGDVIVLDDTTARIKGIVTDRDIVVRAIAVDDDPAKTALSAICSDQVVCVGPGEPIENVVELMRSKAIRRVPVVEDDKPVGILTIGDIAQRLDKKSALADISAAPAQE